VASLRPVAARQLVSRLGGAGIVFVVALGVWWLEALIIPLGEGRDLGTYLGAYVQLLHSHPIDLGYVLGRTPLAPLVVGGLLDVANGALAEPVMSLLYAGSIVAWFLAARSFSRRAALLTVIVLLAYPGYGILFHELSSDALFAAAFAGWSLLLVRTMLVPTWPRFALLGTGVGILVLIRPSNQILLVLALVPLALCATWRRRAVWAVAFLLPALALLGGWILDNGLRYHDYILVRGGNATVPFYRAFVTDRIVSPSNGPKTRELARAVRRDLLSKEPYRSYGITLDRFFQEASPRMEVDLVALSDRAKGWYTNDRWLRDVGVEAVRAHRAKYARGVVGSTWRMLTQGLYRTPSASATNASRVSSSGEAQAGPMIVVNGKRLPKPTEGEPIPAPHEGGITTPDRSIYTVWTSPVNHHMVFVNPGAQARYIALHRHMTELATNLPDRAGNASLAHRFNQASRWFPPPVLWLVLGLLTLLFRRPRDGLTLLVPSVTALLVILLSAAGLPAEPHYSVPVAPAFVLLAAAALLAQREPVSEALTSRLRWLAGLAVGVAGAAWAVGAYGSDVVGYVDIGSIPHDLEVFLTAASKVLHGASPYAFHGDRTYAYPPLLAYIAVPFHALGGGSASLAWMLLSLVAIMASLWLLGVRDWRCYALAAVFLPTRSAVELGTIEPLLLLSVTVAWHWRDRLLGPAAAVGGAVVFKLFLWPLAVWLALTRRFRTAVAAVVIGGALATVSWAAIGFAGLGDYPGVLRRLANHESTSSYSIVALAVRAHLPLVAGRILSLIVALALLAAAAWIARDERRTAHDRDVAVLTLALAAALAASPIVWAHYFLLLLVPLALTRPRLSLLWFVPLAYSPLGESAWPAGDARKLGIALVATLVVLVGALVRSLRIPIPVVHRADPREAPSAALAAPRKGSDPVGV
jgi:Glycosyltransferase family 87/Dolichyl-phosphate-mannose-protein mannosyltransferase